jgi:hypothetical protein
MSCSYRTACWTRTCAASVAPSTAALCPGPKHLSGPESGSANCDVQSSGHGVCQQAMDAPCLWAFRNPPLPISPRVVHTVLNEHGLRYWLLARSVAREIEQYRDAGITVEGVVGIGASPSCGVNTTLDMRRSFETMARCPLAAIDRTMINESVSRLARYKARDCSSVPCADGSDGEEPICPSWSTISSARCAAASCQSSLAGSGIHVTLRGLDAARADSRATR